MSDHFGLMSSKEVTLQVPREFTLDKWFSYATPAQIAVTLSFSAKMQELFTEERSDMTAKLVCARNDETSATIKKMLLEATHLAKSAYDEKISDLTKQEEDARRDVEATAKELEATKIAMNEREKAVSSQVRELEMRLLETKFEYERNLQHAKFESEKQSEQFVNETKKSIAERDEKCAALAASLASADADAQALLALQQQKDAQEFASREQSLREKMQEHIDEARTKRMDADQRVLQLMTERCAETEEVARLKARVSELSQPLHRGTAGELNVAQALRDVGLSVEDTSDGDLKNKGYLDLLVKPDESTRENMRIAVEVKNKKTIKKASEQKLQLRDKDVDDDIRTFQMRAESGIKAGLFDAAIFISIRAHTKMGAPVVLEMFEDNTKRPLAPVAYIGPERAKAAMALTAEQIETQVLMLFCVLEQCHMLRRDVCNGLKDEEITAFQGLFDKMTKLLQQTFAELRRQEQLLSDMATTTTNVRVRCIQMFRALALVNSETPWLQRHMDADWMTVYESAKARSESMKAAEVWNKVGKQKGIIEGTIGKDAMFRAISQETPSLKRPRSPEGGFEDASAIPAAEGAL